MNMENIATLIMSIAALGGIYIALRKAWKVEEPKGQSEVTHSNVQTIALLSKQLDDAYRQIGELRKALEDLRCHKDYQEYLLRGIARLTGSLTANEISVPWIPVSFIDFMNSRTKGEI